MEENQGENRPPKAEGQTLNLKVKDQQGTEVHFKVKSHTKLEKVPRMASRRSCDPCSEVGWMHQQVVAAYCQKKNVDAAQVR
jgi:hypothetical protein